MIMIMRNKMNREIVLCEFLRGELRARMKYLGISYIIFIICT